MTHSGAAPATVIESTRSPRQPHGPAEPLREMKAFAFQLAGRRHGLEYTPHGM